MSYYLCAITQYTVAGAFLAKDSYAVAGIFLATGGLMHWMAARRT